MTPVFVSTNGIVMEARGKQPKDALLFAPSKKSAAEVVKEQRETRRKNSQFLRERYAEAYRR